MKELKAALAAEFGRDPPKGLWRSTFQDVGLANQGEGLWRPPQGHTASVGELWAEAGGRPAGPAAQSRHRAGPKIWRCPPYRHSVPEGFVWQAKTYASLTAIARIITGSSWNGPRFFGLREGEGRKAEKRLEKAA